MKNTRYDVHERITARVSFLAPVEGRITVRRDGRTVGFIDRMSSGKFRGYSFEKGVGFGPASIFNAARAALGRKAVRS